FGGLSRPARPAWRAAPRRPHVPPDDSCSSFLSDPRRSLGSVEEFATAREPAEVRLGVSERRLVGHAARDRGAGAPILLVKEREVSHVLRLLTIELGADRFGALAFSGEEADEDLVADRRRPARSPREPETERPLAARRQAKQVSRAGAVDLGAAGDQAAALEIAQELVYLPDVGVPEGPQALAEAFQQLIPVGLAFGQQREQGVA